MIRRDRELLAELARLNTEMAPLALRIMDGSAGADEQQQYAQRLIAVGQRLQQRAAQIPPTIIEGTVTEGDVEHALVRHTSPPLVALPATRWNLTATVSNPDELHWRLLRERLVEVFRLAMDRREATLPEGVSADERDEVCPRLAASVVALLEQHAINGKGRCRVRGCTRRRWVPWRARRTCPVLRTVQFAMNQPLWIIEKVARQS